MKQISPQSLFVEKPTEPSGLWSLWDMLEHWGYRYFCIANALTYAETCMLSYRASKAGLSSGRDVTVDSQAQEVSFLLEKCQEILGMADERDLSPIPQNVTALIALLVSVRTGRSPRILYADDLIRQLIQIQNDFRSVLSNRRFYALSGRLTEFYGKPELFGPAVAKKFPKAQGDIESAGNCLALGEPTACVMHLNRAMEIAVRRLAKKLNVTVNAKDNMGGVLGNMTEPIKQMPDKTEKQKRKKELWAECRTNLYHVKMAWRDPAHHGKQDYKEKQAHDIMGRVRDFMQQLATLL